MPRTAQLATASGLIYLALTALCKTSFALAGMSFFDAICHAMATVSTGGFSTSDSSLGAYNQADIEVICVLFMLIAGMPFTLFIPVLQGNFKALLNDTQVRAYLGIAMLSVLVMWGFVSYHGIYDPVQGLRRAAFNTVSVMTGTGYASTDYALWGLFPIGMFFFLTFCGGCAGSTSCGIKIFRWQILSSVALAQVRKLLHPHGIFTPSYNHRPIDNDVASQVTAFFFLYICSFGVIAIGLQFMGLDFITALSGAATALSNVGPGLGPVIGPSGNFVALIDPAKWLLTVAMLLGRLELFTFFVILLPAFWRR